MKTSLKILAVLALSGSMTATVVGQGPASLSPPRADVVDAFLDRAPENEKRAYQDVLAKRLAGKADAVRFESLVTTATSTSFPVRGTAPPCSGKVSLDDQAKKYLDALSAIAAGLDAGGLGGIASLVAGAMRFVLDQLGFQKYQDNANCVGVFAIIPAPKAAVDQALAASRVRLTYWNQPGEAPVRLQMTPKVGASFDWSSVDAPTVYETKVALKSATTLGEEGKPQVRDCPVTVVATQLRNWSHTRTRQAQISVDLSTSDVSFPVCADYSVLNREMYLDIMYIEGRERRALEYYIEAISGKP